MPAEMPSGEPASRATLAELAALADVSISTVSKVLNGRSGVSEETRARESGPARVVYDGLGHDTRSYGSAGHVELLRRAVEWLLRDAEVTPSNLEPELSVGETKAS